MSKLKKCLERLEKLNDKVDTSSRKLDEVKKCKAREAAQCELRPVKATEEETNG